MNRIAGIFNLDDAPVHSMEIDRILVTLNDHSDGENSIWVQGKIGIGCTHIGELSRKQPDHSFSDNPQQGCVITFDGRIDNRRELLAVLRPLSLAWQSHISDEELVLAAYKKWDLGCPKHLIGDFAFAIWDKKEQRLLCARDHFGVKPFYYSVSREAFVFASTPGALLASGKVQRRIHAERIADFLVNPLEGLDKTTSFYQDVFRLPPAHMLIVQEGRTTLERYWELCPTVSARTMTDEEYIEAFQELFSEAVRSRLQCADVPASMLSGGMDSSAIVGIARRVLAEEGGGPLHAFSVASYVAETNRETSHISSVLSQGDVYPHLISETEICWWMDELVKALEAETEPFDCLMNSNRAVYLHARDHGVKTLLDGVDGDILLSGSGHLLQVWWHGSFRTIVEETLKADGLSAEYKVGKNDFINSFLSAVTPIAPDWLRKLRRPRRDRKVFENSIRHSIIDRNFAVQSRIGERFGRFDSHSPRPPSFSQIEFHKIVLNHPFLTVGLERYERVASAFGVEARHPFTDVRLAEFCLGLPWQLKTRHGWTKMILRRAMEPYLPSEVIWRRDKDSLMWEVNRLILKERKDFFYQITQDEGSNLKPYVDVQKLNRFWLDYLTRGDETHAPLIWSGIALALWLRRQRNIQAGLRWQ